MSWNNKVGRRCRSPNSVPPGRSRRPFRNSCSRPGRRCCSNNLSRRRDFLDSRRCQRCRKKRKGCCCRSYPGRCRFRSRSRWDRHSMASPDHRTCCRFHRCISCWLPCRCRCSDWPHSKANQGRRRFRRTRRCIFCLLARHTFRPGPCRCPPGSSLRCCRRCPCSMGSPVRRK